MNNRIVIAATILLLTTTVFVAQSAFAENAAWAQQMHH